MMEMVRGLTALSKRGNVGDENGGDEDGAVSGVCVGQATWVDFFRLYYLSVFSFLYAKQPGFWDWDG